MSAYKVATLRPNTIEIVYCDTGVENPVLDAYVKKVLANIRQESPIFNVHLLKAPIHDRYFVKIIGRGYPPPTKSFRWCTNGLRIRPVSRFISHLDPARSVLVLGTRMNESSQRDRVIARQTDPYGQKQSEGSDSYDVFAPVVEMSLEEIWDAVFFLSTPMAIDPMELERLYRGASGECPTVKAPTAAPCGSGRFGCWTCTVVRQDKSAKELINSGHSELRHYLAFRNWLAELRNDPKARWPRRRNGNEGLGPFTIEARKEILGRLDSLEDRLRAEILAPEERGAIASLWNLDHIPRLAMPKTNQFPI